MSKNPKQEKTTIGPDAEGRYYYKHTDGHAAYNIKEPIERLLGSENAQNYVEITKAEWDELTFVPETAYTVPEPTAEEIAEKEKLDEILQLKHALSQTDYVVIKIAEALADNNTELVESLKVEYAEVLSNRVTWRSRVNELEGE